MRRALLSLDGLSVGDGFGQCFFTRPEIIQQRIEKREPPQAPWMITDDSVMAISIVRILKRYGTIDQDRLAAAFVEAFLMDPDRGYGGMAVNILRAIADGTGWKTASSRAFNGEGSCGNGGAMRVAPIGAYFADDYDRVLYEAKLSAEVTHAHPDGKTGAAAIALAAAWMVNNPQAGPGFDLIEFVLERIPETDTYHELKRALDVPLNVTPQKAAATLGNGSKVIASDTVPFCLWCVARHMGEYTGTLWSTVSGLGDRDTTCAIAGGIAVLGDRRSGIPAAWLEAREKIVF